MLPSHIGRCHGMTDADWLVPVLLHVYAATTHEKEKAEVYNVSRFQIPGLALKIEPK